MGKENKQVLWQQQRRLLPLQVACRKWLGQMVPGIYMKEQNDITAVIFCLSISRHQFSSFFNFDVNSRSFDTWDVRVDSFVNPRNHIPLF